ncbi:MAG: hypothetical protein IJY55_03860 [Clostridia bacterium]|nr:hypothetical protein [Clostridia bacterium]
MAQEEKDMYFVSIRNPQLPLQSGYEEYIATAEDFKKYCNEVFELDNNNELDDFLLSSYLRAKVKVEVIQETYNEDRTIEGFRRIVETSKGSIKVAYTAYRENRVYVRAGNVYLRGYRVFFSNLCTDNSDGFEPLNKLDNGGNIEVLQWNTRPCRRGIQYINNKLQNILFIIDAVYKSKKQMEYDINHPKPINLEKFIIALL